MSLGRAPVLGPLLAALVSASGIAWGLAAPPVVDGPPRTPKRATASEETRALFGGLSPGDRLGGWRVNAITGPDERGEIRIELSARDVAFSLMVAPKTDAAHPPPVATEHWAIYYGHVDPPDTVLPRNVIRGTTGALAKLIREHE